ncbi:MAG: DUF4440 domain-containing protein [Myxococcaceae bacterium]|nr:DUF4440 domain-containing protein [Myxococcaceae bacterium]
MKNLVLAATLLSSLAFAAEPAKADAKPAEGANAMAGWKPKKVVKKDTKGIEALYKASEEAHKAGDFAASEALHDFPVFMLTDNAAGVVSGGQWSKEDFEKFMKPAFENMPKDVKVTTKTKVTFVTETIAFVEESHTMTAKGAKPESWTSASIVIQKDGKWLFKSGAEGGWGDSMGEQKTEAAPAAQPAPAAKAEKAPAAAPAAAPAKK